MRVRRLVPGDEKIVEICVAIGAAKYPRFDTAAATAWGYAALGREDVGIFVTVNCFALAVTYQRFWAPGKMYAELILICSGRDDRRSGGQLRALGRAVREWAMERGAVKIDVGSALNGLDIEPVARSMGPARQEIGWVIELPAKGA
jgi:hypothetical protein